MKRFLVPPVMRAGAHPYKYGPKDAIPNISEAGKQATESVKKKYNMKEPLFKKDPVGRNMNNLWTGYGYGGKGRALATASLLGGAGIMASRDTTVPNQIEELSEVESLQSTRGDGLGYESQVGPDSGLTASGDLVFAMHKTRHTGQF